MFKQLPLPREWIEATRDALPVAKVVESSVGEIWERERLRRPGIFDGQIFCTEQVNPEKISGRFVPYRYFLAQLREPELFKTLKIRALAVSGVLTCPDGLVFGKREDSLTQEGGCWELLPAGGVDLASRTSAGRLDLRRQVLEELAGEIGLGEEFFTRIEPVLMMEDQTNFIIDVIFAIGTSLSAGQILAAHAALPKPEHGEIKIAPARRRDDLPGGIASNLLPASDWILSRLEQGD